MKVRWAEVGQHKDGWVVCRFNGEELVTRATHEEAMAWCRQHGAKVVFHRDDGRYEVIGIWWCLVLPPLLVLFAFASLYEALRKALGMWPAE